MRTLRALGRRLGRCRHREFRLAGPLNRSGRPAMGRSPFSGPTGAGCCPDGAAVKGDNAPTSAMTIALDRPRIRTYLNPSAPPYRCVFIAMALFRDPGARAKQCGCQGGAAAPPFSLDSLLIAKNWTRFCRAMNRLVTDWWSKCQ